MKENTFYNDEENIKNIGKNIFSLLENKREQKLIINELKNLDNKNIDLTKLFEDKTKNSLLVSSVYYNLTEVSIYLIDYFRNKFNEKNSFTLFLDYLNLRNIKGYDALLYSAYRGNYETFMKLMDNGANINSNNINGLNVLHLSVQGNRLNIITTLMEKYVFDINKQDNQGNSALHWAVYFNNQQSIDYLLYYNININITDNNNCTAMDIAIKRENEDLIEKIKNSFIIKYGLSVTKNDIKKYFTKIEIFQIFMRKYLYIFFLAILILSEIYNQKLISITINNSRINFIFILLFLYLFFLYYLLIISDSDKEKSNSKETLFSLLKKGYDMNNVCPWCSKNKSNKSCHCPYCKKCIEYQEFHNSLLNICIRKNNFKLYLFYLAGLTIIFILKFFILIFCIKRADNSFLFENKYTFLLDIILNFIICSLSIFRLIRKFRLFKISKSDKITWEHKNDYNHFFPEMDNRIIIN